IALRHHSTKKNKTDNVQSVPIIHYRYMVAFIFPITATIKSFLSKKGHDPDTVEKMHTAWFKAVTLTVILWTYPYINKNEF
ncbi:MAG: protoglobin domain-containing protein, partial [Cyclobacteriaceae bacterium]